MKKIITLCLVLALSLCSISVPAQGIFNDTAGHWAEEEIEKAYQNKIINGDPDGSFRPNDTVSRAEFVKMLTADICNKMMVTIPESYGGEGHWAFIYVNFASQTIFRPLTDAEAVDGLTPGFYRDGLYDIPIQRWEMAYYISEAVRNVLGISGDASMAAYSDLMQVMEKYAAELVDAIGNCVNLGLIRGDENGNFNAGNTGTRAEAATLINRFDALMEEVIVYYTGLEQEALEKEMELNQNLVIYDEIPQGHPVVTMTMENGKTVKMELYPEYAPQTVANFVSLVESGFYDGLTFHRVMEGFMAQGGDPQGDGSGGSGKNIKGEFLANDFTQNTLSHTRGVVSMARASSYNSAQCQFFICYDDASFLDGQYAAFGKVIEGMEVVDEFLKVEMVENALGEMASPKEPIVIKTMTVAKDGE